MKILHCAICKNKEKLTLLYKSTLPKNIESQRFSARKTPDRIHYRLVRCNNCGLIFSSPILPPAKIAKLYKESSYTYQGHLPYLAKTYLNIFNKSQKYTQNLSQKVLDIGCSNGFFLQTLKENGINKVYGVEPSKQEAQNAPKEIRKNIKVSLFKKGLFPKNTFDVVTCFHTLDHIVEVNRFLKDTNSVLKKNGILIIVVHDTQGLSVKLFKEKSPIFDIQHIYLFNKNNLNSLLKNYGFETKEVRSLNNSFSLEYWLTMSPIPKAFKKPARLFKKITLSLPAGNLYLIAQKS